MCKYAGVVNKKEGFPTEKERVSEYSNVGLNAKDTKNRMFGRLYDERLIDLEDYSWTIESDSFKELISLMAKTKSDDTDSNIVAGYTYLGQFITHEIVRDSDPEREKLSVRGRATPYLNLDSVYFAGEAIDETVVRNGKFVLRDVHGIQNADLPRDRGEAKIPEPRNDENIIIAQFHLLWLKLHNILVDWNHREEHELSIKERYFAAKTFCTLVFQRVVVEDYLKTLLHPLVFSMYFEKHHSYVYEGRVREFEIPLEFSHAAFRFGHTMIRSRYTLQGVDNKQVDLEKIIRSGSDLSIDEIIEWRHFFEIENGITPQRAMKLNLKLPPDLEGEKRALRKEVKASVRKKTSQCDEYYERAIRHILFKDILASKELASGGALINMLKEARTVVSGKVESLLEDLMLPSLEDYLALVEFSDGFREISVGNGKFLGAKNSPLWMFLLRESEVFPFLEKAKLHKSCEKETSDTEEQCSRVQDQNLKEDEEMTRTVLLNADTSKLGPMASVIIAEVLQQSIMGAKDNILDSWGANKAKLTKGLADLYSSWAMDHRTLTMGFLINFISEHYWGVNDE